MEEEPSRIGIPAEEVAEIFRPGGCLARGCAGDGVAYERRPQQEVMAAEVAVALSEPGHLAVEAGTGVGKSYAYLAPLILFAARNESRAVVSTYTISLQEQLVRKDIPFLLRHMRTDLEPVLVKGRGNYLCLRRLARARRMERDLFQASAAAWLDRLDEGIDRAGDGSLQELRDPPPPDVWDAVCAEEGNCAGVRCPQSGACFFMKARRRMRSSRLLIVNHHLLFSDLAMRRHAAGFLPEFDSLVLDEAHQVEGVASERLGLRLTQYAFEHWMRRLYSPVSQKGLMAVLRNGSVALAVERLGGDVERLFRDLAEQAGLGADRSHVTVREPLGVETAVPDRIREIAAQLRVLAEGMEEDSDLRPEIQQARRKGEELGRALQAFLGRELEGHVYWMETGRRRRVQLHAAPVEVAPLLKPILFDAVPSIVMTSATLAVNGALDYFRSRIGAEPCRAVRVGSPFDYARQMRLRVASRMPDPTRETEFVEAAAVRIRESVLRTGGGAFVLLTSASMLREVVGRVREPLEAAGLDLLVQGGPLPRHAMLEQFRKGGRQVLFGLDSFWMGVDVRGEALRNVVIVRLPFSVPDHPLIQARLESLRSRGGNPFRDYSLPEAVIRFRQGVGRLIRTVTDTGEVTILDPRILSKWYGKWFLRSLPEGVPMDDLDEAGPESGIGGEPG
jgi:ATP-dependent DNA helicase DinG